MTNDFDDQPGPTCPKCAATLPSPGAPCPDCFEAETLATLGLGIDLRLQGIPDVRVNWAMGDMDGFSVSLYWVR